MNPNEWTLDQCRDFLAECKGWAGFSLSGRKPIPATLDAIAGALPEGVTWREVKHVCGESWSAVAEQKSSGSLVSYSHNSDTERLARARAACLAWIEHKKGTNQC